MVVAVAVFDLYLPFCRGLKEKRAFVRPLKTRLRGDFQISASEVGAQDVLQRAVIGVSAVGADRAALEPLFEKVSRYVASFAEAEGAEVLAEKSEFLAYGDVSRPGSVFGEKERHGA